MVQNLEELRGLDLATLLAMREKSMREVTGTKNPSQNPQTRPRTATLEPFSKTNPAPIEEVTSDKQCA